MNLEQFYFPVTETPIYYAVNADYCKLDSNKLIRHIDNNQKPIAIVSKGYNFITNKEIIENTIGCLENLGVKFYIDQMGTFLSDKRMMIHAIFQDNYIADDNNGVINLSLVIHNSYDMSTAARARFGTFRTICSNGALLSFSELTQYYHKHTKNLFVNNMKEEIEKALQVFPHLKERIDLLRVTEFRIDLPKVMDNVYRIMPDDFRTFVKPQAEIIKTMWQLYNLMTYYITHKVQAVAREVYYQKISKLFKV